MDAETEAVISQIQDTIEVLRVRVNEILKWLKKPECYQIPPTHEEN